MKTDSGIWSVMISGMLMMPVSEIYLVPKDFKDQENPRIFVIMLKHHMKSEPLCFPGEILLNDIILQQISL